MDASSTRLEISLRALDPQVRRDMERRIRDLIRLQAESPGMGFIRIFHDTTRLEAAQQSRHLLNYRTVAGFALAQCLLDLHIFGDVSQYGGIKFLPGHFHLRNRSLD